MKRLFSRDFGPELAVPEPHPLDYDWRFTASCLSAIDKVVSRLGGESIATLGAPTLYLHLWNPAELQVYMIRMRASSISFGAWVCRTPYGAISPTTLP